MSSWLEEQRQKILTKQFPSEVLIQSLITDKKLKRKYYKCKDEYITLQNIPLFVTDKNKGSTKKDEEKKPDVNAGDGTNKLFSVLKCDITKLEIDCIVNAANEGLLGGGGVDEAIHGAAGPLLQFECANLSLCYPGNSVITKGYLLPADYVIHTVGPYLDEQNKPQSEVLINCYKTILDVCVEYKIESIAIPPISTGFYGFPKDEAAEIAVSSIIKYISENKDKCKYLERIIYVDITDDGIEFYRKALNKIMGSKK